MKLKDINKMLSQQTLQKIQDNYSTALGIPLSIINNEGETITLPSNQSKLWNLIKDHPILGIGTKKELFSSIQKSERTGQVVIFERHSDCFGFTAPIYANGQIIAYFVGGFVRFGNPNIENAERFAKQLNIEIDTYLDAFLSLPFFTEEKLEASAKLIKIIGSTIYTLEEEGSEIREKNNELNKDLKITTDKLISTEYRYKQIFDNAYDGIYISDFLDGTFLEINSSGAKILGYNNANEVLKKRVEDCYVNPDKREQFKKIIISKGKIANWIAHIKTPSGEEKFIETNATITTDKKTNRQVIHGIFRDLGPREHRAIHQNK